MRSRSIGTCDSKPKGSSLAALGLLLISTGAADAQTTDTWSGGASGLWNVAGNWSAGVVPNNGVPSGSTYNVIIGSGASVTMNMVAGISNLTVNSGGSLAIGNGEALTINGTTLSNAGNFSLGSTGSTTQLIVGASNVTLSGGGTVTLSNSVQNYIYGAASSDTLTNQETIQGAGHIGNGQMILVNSGTIDANQSAGMTINVSAGSSNTGTLEATAGAALGLTGTYANTGGTISANTGVLQLTTATVNGGAVTLTGASTLQMNNSSIHGGSTLTNSSTGTIEMLANNNTLGGTINNPAGGLLKIDNGAALSLESGAYPILGAVQLNAAGSTTQLILAGTSSNVTLSGGTVTLSNSIQNYIYGASSTDTLTNQETIQGAGHIGNGQMILANSGTIDANQSAGMTINVSAGSSNTGTLEATAGAALGLTGAYANTGGTISANAGVLQLTTATVNGGAVTLTGASTLQMNNSSIHGGSTLTNSSTGTIEMLANNNTLGGTINNPAGGLLKIDNGAALSLESGAYPTLGAVQLNSSGSTTQLILAGASSNVTLSGGTVTLSNGVQNYIYGASSTDTLTNQETIQGAGHIGNGQMILVNSGTIDANQSAGMTINVSAGSSNTGTLEATAGAALGLTGAYANTGGTISANAGVLQLTTATVNGGAVTLTGASTLQMNNSSIHGGSTLTNSSTGTIEMLANNNTLGGTINNPAGGLLKIDNGAALSLESGAYPTLGAVQLNASGATTSMILAGSGSNVTLSGGTVTLSNSVQNYIYGASSTDTLTNQETIQGAGHIGNGQMILVNSGTIDATGSAGMVIQNNSLTNSGTLMVGGGVLMHVLGGTFTNFSASTLTGGTYNTAGTLEIDQLGTTGGEIVTNAATIVLNGAGSSFVDSASKDALSSFATNAATGAFSLLGGRNYTTAGAFTNNGIVSVGSGSTFSVGGALSNFSGTTLTGGTYNVTGTLQFAGANIVTNAANVTLTGASSAILNSTTSGSGLANFASNAAKSTFSVMGGRTFTTAGKFTNKGTLTVGSGSTFGVGSTLTNFSGSTLTAGTFNVTGTFEFAGANVVTNAAKITLTGAGSKILNSTTSTDGLANFAANAAAGSFTLAGKRSFTTAGNFSTAGTLSIGAGSTFGVGGTGVFTETAGKTTDSGILSASGGANLSGGSLIGIGSVTGNLINSGGIITPGTSATKTGTLTDNGVYTQGSTGVLDIYIGGTTAGSKYDVLKSTTAVLGGTLTIKPIGTYVPTIGSTFKIMNFNSETGQFATVNGSINTSEHYAVTYEATDVLLTVVSGPVAAGLPNPQARIGRGGLVARAIDEQIDTGGRFRTAMPSLQMVAAAPAARFSSSTSHLDNTPRFASASIGAKLNAMMAGHFAPATAGHSASIKPSAGAPAHENAVGHQPLGGKIFRGNFQFSLPSLSSKPQFGLFVN